MIWELLVKVWFTFWTLFFIFNLLMDQPTVDAAIDALVSSVFVLIGMVLLVMTMHQVVPMW